MNYACQKTVMVSLFFPILLLSHSAHAGGREIVRSSQGKLELVCRLPKDSTQTAKEVATAKKSTKSVSKIHAFIKDYGLTLIPFASMFIPREYLGPVNGAIAGAALGAVINDTDRLKGAVFGATLGVATGTAMVINHPAKNIIFRTSHGAILNTESVDAIASGAVCGAAQGTAEMAIKKVFCPSAAINEDNTVNKALRLGVVIAGSMAFVRGIGMPKKDTFPMKFVAVECLGVLAKDIKEKKEPEVCVLNAITLVALRKTQHNVATRIREKFTELEEKRAQAAQDKTVS